VRHDNRLRFLSFLSLIAFVFRARLPPCAHPRAPHPRAPRREEEKIESLHGHVTSLAVSRSHRKLGLATKLMTMTRAFMLLRAARAARRAPRAPITLPP
jgi:ribosomal protein S18 acetylase RimI-like enzyme